MDDSNERMNAKIRKSVTQKVPYALIVGEKEANANCVSVRTRTGQQLNALPIEDFIAATKEKIAKREIL